MRTKKGKIIVVILFLLVCFCILALTLFRPITANFYHQLRALYVKYSTKQSVEALYEYNPQSYKTYDVLLEKLPISGPLSEDQQALYSRTVSVLLKEDLWTERDMYDAAQYLMVPMCYAFYSQDAEKISEFHQFFGRFYKDISGEDVHNFSKQVFGVDLLQFYYFCCEYLRLCAVTNEFSSTPDGMYNYLYQQLEYEYTEIPGNWNSEKNYQTRAEQILLHKEYPFSYYSALSDIDLFPLASLCDLRVVAKLSGQEDTELMQKGCAFGLSDLYGYNDYYRNRIRWIFIPSWGMERLS